jgi:hypothetical protein
VFFILKIFLFASVFSGATMANDNFDSGHAVIPVLHPNGEIHSVAAPPDTELADLHSSLMAAGYSHPAIDTQEKQPTREGSLEYSDEFRSAAKKAYDLSGDGRLNREAGFSVDKSGVPGPMQYNDMKHGDESGSLAIQTEPSALGTLHTHRDVGNPQPSPHDVGRHLYRPVDGRRQRQR